MRYRTNACMRLAMLSCRLSEHPAIRRRLDATKDMSLQSSNPRKACRKLNPAGPDRLRSEECTRGSAIIPIRLRGEHSPRHQGQCASCPNAASVVEIIGHAMRIVAHLCGGSAVAEQKGIRRTDASSTAAQFGCGARCSPAAMAHVRQVPRDVDKKCDGGSLRRCRRRRTVKQRRRRRARRQRSVSGSFVVHIVIF